MLFLRFLFWNLYYINFRGVCNNIVELLGLQLIVLLKTMHIVHSPFLKQSRRPLIAIIKLIIKCVKDKLL